MLTPTADLVAAAAAAGTGIPAFNGITLEHGEAIVAGAEQAGRPVILALSHNAVRFHQDALEPIAAGYRLLAERSSVPIGLHLDHVEDLDLVEAAIGLGFGSVMYDAATRPYEENVDLTARAAKLMHENGMWLEAELGEIGGKDGAHAPHVRTDPDEARSYVEATGVDALAVAVGSSHAMTEATAALDLDLIGRLRDAVPVPLVLHGSSGVPDAGIAAAVAAGLVKINVGTQLNIAYTGAVRAGLAETTSPDPRRYLKTARAAMTDVVVRLIGVVSSGGAR
ncbi:MAG: class II fructose-bisphosphate aldolase [Nocardioidaceae bacterium]